MPWLQALDLFTLPSYGEEGVPQAIMQAMACALPVVSTPVGAIGEAVEDGVTGLLVAPPVGRGARRGARPAARRRRHCARASAPPGARAPCATSASTAMLDRMEAVFRSALQGRT